VMVGEIRDLETAQIAVQASLTGHLVLSTLHTNTATGAVTRLRDMASSRSCCRRAWWACWPSDCARVESRHPRGVHGREYERRLLNLPDDAPRRPFIGRVRATLRAGIAAVPHLRTGADRRARAHDDPRRRLGARARALRRMRTRASVTTAAPRCWRASRRSRKSSRSHARTDPWVRSSTSRSTPLAAIARCDRGRHGPPRAPAAARTGAAAGRSQGSRRAGHLDDPSTADIPLPARAQCGRPGAGHAPAGHVVKSGLPLEEALLAVSQQTDKPRVHSTILGVRSKVMEGHTLADGLKDFPSSFPKSTGPRWRPASSPGTWTRSSSASPTTPTTASRCAAGR